MSLSNLESFLKSVAKDDRLREFQAPVRDDLEAVTGSFQEFFASSIPLVRDLSQHLLGVTGKQFRPSLVLLVAGGGQPRREDAVFAATVIELIHTATLVHDDTIDKSMVRRGLPTINAMYNDMVATILGDYIYTKAFHELLERGMAELVPVVARTTYRMSIGEMLQLQQKSDLELTEEAYFDLVDQKTASLMSASTEIGALVGRLTADRTARFRAFGEALGRAYQVTDDLFDYLGDPAEIGKGVRTDLPEGKITLPLIRALAEAGPRDRALLKEIVGRRAKLEEADWSALLSLLEKTGAIGYCRQKAKELAGESIALLRGEPESAWRDSLEKAVAYAIQRIH